MAILDYEIGGNIVSSSGGEAVLKIPCNRTMVVEQLSFNAPQEPELVYGIKGTKELFEHFKPLADFTFKIDCGTGEKVVNEEIPFNKIEDFLPDKILANSPSLSALKCRIEFYSMLLLYMASAGNIADYEQEKMLELKKMIIGIKNEIQNYYGKDDLRTAQ